MTRDEVIALAIEVDCQHVNLTGDKAKAAERLHRFAAAIESRVREECAVICDAQGEEWDSDAVIIDKNYAAYCAAAIRARKG